MKKPINALINNIGCLLTALHVSVSRVYSIKEYNKKLCVANQPKI
jgi:hypothetical protein